MLAAIAGTRGEPYGDGMEGLLRLALATAILVGVFALIAYAGPIIDAIERSHRRWQHRAQGPAPTGRPIEILAADARRLRRACTLVPSGAPMARRRGVVLAYEDVLVEAARSLGIDHGLRNLPLGPVRDLERLRLEASLEASGLRLTT